jgi:hypothetical protein
MSALTYNMNEIHFCKIKVSFSKISHNYLFWVERAVPLGPYASLATD